MAQRGGAVQSHLRFSKERIYSDLIPRGEADLILSVEPLEALRYLDYLRPGGESSRAARRSSTFPITRTSRRPGRRSARIPGSVVVDSEALAKEAGTSKAQNTVMLGAAAEVPGRWEDGLREFIRVLFAPRGEKILERQS